MPQGPVPELGAGTLYGSPPSVSTALAPAALRARFCRVRRDIGGGAPAPDSPRRAVEPAKMMRGLPVVSAMEYRAPLEYAR